MILRRKVKEMKDNKKKLREDFLYYRYVKEIKLSSL